MNTLILYKYFNVALFIPLVINFASCGEILGIEKNVHLLVPGMEKMLIAPGRRRLEIFCYEGEPQSIVTLLKTVQLDVNVPKDNFYYYEGSNSSSVKSQYESQSWFSFAPWRQSTFRLNIYNHSCIGIDSSETFTVRLKVRHVDFWRVVTLSVGVGLFFMAPLLAHNVLFHYVTGVSVGIFGSLLVIVFMVSRLIPKKTGAVTVLIGGWGLVVYTLQYLWSNCLTLLKEYHTVAVGYVVIAGLVSFALVYRWGPVKDSRTLSLVQWALQLFALSLIFLSSDSKEFTLAMILLLLMHYNIPLSWKYRLRTYWLRHFPPKRRLLTEEEYLDQSRVETKKALEELREFCHSPDCNAWKTMSRLRTPQRFAEFVEGGFHLTDDEILAYESDHSNQRFSLDDNDLLTSDEDEDEQPQTRFR